MRVKEGHITQRQAAEQFKLSRRWIEKLVKRLREKGDGAVIHGLKGRGSIVRETEQTGTALIRQQYADYGPTQVAEVLAS
jgi:transposase